MIQHKVVLCCAFALYMGGAQQGGADEWEFSLTPYVWAPSISATTRIEADPPVDSGKSWLKSLDSALLLKAEARRGRWSFLGEFNYLNLSDDFAVLPDGAGTSWGLQGTMVAIAAAYQLGDMGRIKLEAIGGLRAWDISTSTSRTANSSRADAFFVDPLVGLRVAAPLGTRSTFHGLANIGGSSFGSDKQIEAMAQIKWPLTQGTDIAAGYRYLSLKFDDSFVIDSTFEGPFVSVSFNF